MAFKLMTNWREWRDKRNSLIKDIREVMYWHIHVNRNGKNWPNWKGVHVVKMPTDLILYAEAIFANKPDYIVETGTRFGGSALFFADMLTLAGGAGKVITVDVRPPPAIVHPKIEFITGSSTDRGIVKDIASRVSGNVMVVLDSDHHQNHVTRELRRYGAMVTKGQFMVCEDCYSRSETMHGPGYAVRTFLGETTDFVQEEVTNKYLFGITRGGWLRKV